MGIFQPFNDLLIRLGLRGCPCNPPVGLKYLPPECQLILRGFLRPKPAAPPVREALQPCAFCWCQPADDILRLHDMVIPTERLLVPKPLLGAHACG